MTSVSESMLPALDSWALGPPSTSATLLDAFIPPMVSLQAPSASAIARIDAGHAALASPTLPFIIR
jgi:hypothetical protein